MQLGAVATLVIDRPEKRNALSIDVIEALTDRFLALSSMRQVRCIVLTGVGNKAFAAGADLTELNEAMASPDSARRYDSMVTALYDAIEACHCPVVARMNGHAVGGGLLLALACDLRVAAANAKLGVPSGRVGLMLSPREYELVGRAVGSSKAKLLLYAGRVLTASQGHEWGLVDEVSEEMELDATVDQLVGEICRAAPLSVTAAKRMISMAREHDPQQVRKTTFAAYESVYHSHDLREGLAAFQEKREPSFTGR
jgi:enoyl-CoA hydratase